MIQAKWRGGDKRVKGAGNVTLRRVEGSPHGEGDIWVKNRMRRESDFCHQYPGEKNYIRKG